MVTIITLSLFLLISCQENPLPLESALSTSSSTTNISYYPQGGSYLNGKVFTLEGENLENVSAISFNQNSCTINSRSSTKVTCIMPGLATGWYQVKVTNNAQSETIGNFASGAQVFGQDNFRSGDINLTKALRYPQGLSVSSNDLYVVDAGGERFLEFDLNQLTSYETLPTVHAQESLYRRENNDDYNLEYICKNSTHSFVSDGNRNRILVFLGDPKASKSEALYVIGQANLDSESANEGGVSASTLWKPGDMDCSDSKLAVVDRKNHRVLIYNLPITQNKPNATSVLGQNDFTSNSSDAGVGSSNQIGFNNPHDVSFDENRLIVSDKSNNRILLYDNFPTDGSQAVSASKVLCQTDFTSNSSGITDASECFNTAGVKITSDRIFAVDNGNNRVLIWDATGSDFSAITNGQAADIYLGQPANNQNDDFNGGISLGSLYNPHDVEIWNDKLFVTDYHANRLMVWNSLPSSSGTAADFVWGQKDGTTVNKGDSQASKKGLYYPYGVSMAQGTLFIAAYFQCRILGFNNISFNALNPSPNFVMGQADFTKSTCDNLENASFAATEDTYNLPRKIYHHQDSDYFYLSDAANHRVLVWSTPPTNGLTLPNYVIGQADFTTSAKGNNSQRLNTPRDICQTGTRIFISESGSHRIKAFSTITGDFQAADFVLGQASFSDKKPNQNLGAPTASTLSAPSALYCDEDRLIVTDTNNNRVLIWSPLPASTNEPADIVLGQDDFVSAQANKGELFPSQSTLSAPLGVEVMNEKLYIIDRSNHRLLVWNTIPTTSSVAADTVLGQDSFNAEEANKGVGFGEEISIDSFYFPIEISEYDEERFLFSDFYNQRVLILPKL